MDTFAGVRLRKVKDLEARYPQILSYINHKENSGISIHRTTKTTTNDSLLRTGFIDSDESITSHFSRNSF